MSADEAADDEWLSDLNSVYTRVDIDRIRAEDSQTPHEQVVEKAEVHNGLASQRLQQRWNQYVCYTIVSN